VIDLVREVPEAMKPKKVAIGGQPTLEGRAQHHDEADAA
jgi:molecular chaperone IbpA